MAREATPRYDSSGRLVGLEPAAEGNVLLTPGEAAVAGGTVGVEVEVVAPTPLKELLERHLDVVRLGRTMREEVDEAEWARLVDAAPAQARDLLQTEGYFSAEIGLQRQPRRARGEPDRVKMIVNPGPRARVSRLTLELQGDIDTEASADPSGYAAKVREQLRADWPLQTSREFGNTAWGSAKAALLARLRAAGYANATLTGTGAQVDREKNEVRLFVVAESGPLFRLGSMQIEGLHAHTEDSVRHLLTASEGAPVTDTMLLDFQERLQKTGLFASVNVALDTDPATAAQARVQVKLREAPLQVYTFGTGVSANTGARASVEHVYRRVFGFALTSRNKIELGQKRQAWDGELSTHTGQGLYRNLLGGTVEWLKSDTDEVLSQRLRLGRAQDATRIERLFFLEGERSERTTDSSVQQAIALSINFHGVWRDLDSIVLPTRGLTFAGQIGTGRSHATEAPSGFFTRAYGRLTGYLPFGDAWYGQARIEVGQVLLQRGVIAPDSQRFRAGGDDSVRGYGYRTLGPTVDGVVGSGSTILTTSIEVARPISANLPSVWGAAFIDAGNAAESFKALHPALGAGFGVRWRSPVGPLRLDLAYGYELRRWRLHFSVGIAF